VGHAHSSNLHPFHDELDKRVRIPFFFSLALDPYRSSKTWTNLLVLTSSINVPWHDG
jgi:hypothetical protein